MKLFSSSKSKKKKTTFEASLEYPEFLNFLLNKEKKEEFKQRAKTFVLFWKAYKRIVGYGIRYASDEIKKKRWREVYGILVGSIEKNFVFIKDAIPMVAGERAGVEYEDKQYVDMAEIDYQIYEKALKDEKNDFIVGWWHTHPGFGFFFSPVDSLTQLGYQTNNPDAIGLIFDHTQMNKNSLGIAALHLKNAQRGIPGGYEPLNLFFKPEKKELFRRIHTLIKDIQKNQTTLKKHLDYVEQNIRNKGIAKLQELYGVIPIPKKNSAQNPIWTVPEESYTWNTDEDEIEYVFPPFRDALEEKITEYEQTLNHLEESAQFSSYKEKKREFIQNVLDSLEKPKNLCIMILKDLSNKMKFINKWWDYLGTDERLLCNNAFKQISKYTKTLNEVELNAFAKLN
ncbi:MAG: hypothetical protein BAJALOKI1v1_170017 [Promethearchaeota archaeon]|nr:MAG: hypothetical protein BAJALOKI1v1_170017 [Candidatus Lokiarchaeota archaeon]